MTKPITVFDFAKHCMTDKEFLSGGISNKERKWLDAIGFEYTMKDGCIYQNGEDLHEFYTAMYTLLRLQKKYYKEGD